ncbi:MAG: DUF2220 family protein [Prevotellaceae bacterium]|jgi:hypothetical protein|nr:DUF2220 family protein [Prevotellaceae bacterium]
MITPKEIQQQCSNWWKSVLAAHIESVDFFPKEISRIGKIPSKDLMKRLPEYQKSLKILRNNSKSNKKNGYSLVEIERQFDKIGKQYVPEKIVIETLKDYLKITGKEKEYQLFTLNYKLLISELPNLKEWAILHHQKLIDCNVWTNIIKVCNYFIENPKPNLYIRELPIQIHTKFIEENKAIIKDLLDVLIEEYVNQEYTLLKDFEKRFNLKYAEPTVRFRILDKNISQQYFSEIDDLSIPVSQFEKLDLSIKNVLIVENKTNLLTIALTLPDLIETIVVFGSGYKVENLKNTKWFKRKKIYYWGDLDAQGFEILSQFRGYFPHVKSILMDKATFKQFESEKVEGKEKSNSAPNLTNEEQQLYAILKANNWRLEQEKIPLEYAIEIIKKTIICPNLKT